MAEVRPDRRYAREQAIAVLYAHHLSGRPLGEVMESALVLNRKEELQVGPGEDLPAGALGDEATRAFLRNLVLKTVRDSDSIDALIARKAFKWDLERIALLDRIILRLAIAEMLHTDIPTKVSINEAIEIAKKYSTENSGKFVNGILDSVKADVEQQRAAILGLPDEG
ncbi:MAG: transcription antitermination factor NusB [Calditrichaeota bacterium]|nr:transcription antitermination factor NusB [Candidatus Cloacimonadota bacterium]MCB1045609.1 transcription antitermination factor NusB [Calditrichota bacterium]MCB9472856.1 transcription antitermination factor NusB [Candidatus Delongbacteria bacterium]